MAAACELWIDRMMAHHSAQATRSFYNKLKEYCQIPKSVLMDYCFSHAAHACLPPWKASPDLTALLKAFCIYDGCKEKGKLSEDNPSSWSDAFDDADYHGGVVVTRWVTRLEDNVILPLLKDAKNRLALEHLARDLLPDIERFPT